MNNLVLERKLIDYLVYVGPHAISGEGWQFAFDFGHTQVSIYSTPDSRGVELLMFGDHQMWLNDVQMDEIGALLLTLVTTQKGEIQ
jgi:hypothetical protein